MLAQAAGGDPNAVQATTVAMTDALVEALAAAYERLRGPDQT